MLLMQFFCTLPTARVECDNAAMHAADTNWQWYGGYGFYGPPGSKSYNTGKPWCRAMGAELVTLREIGQTRSYKAFMDGELPAIKVR